MDDRCPHDIEEKLFVRQYTSMVKVHAHVLKFGPDDLRNPRVIRTLKDIAIDTRTIHNNLTVTQTPFKAEYRLILKQTAYDLYQASHVRTQS